MGMVSSVHLAELMGLPHKQIKRQITANKVPCVAAGMTQHDGGRLQRRVIVDEEVFMNKLASNAKTTAKKKSTGKKKG
jgi:phage regulator Rha-like protein